MSNDFMADVIFGFSSPARQAAILKQEREYEQRLIKGEAGWPITPWDEDKTKFSKVLVLDGKTFNPHRLFDVAPCSLLKPGLDPKKHRFSPAKKFAYRNSILPAGRRLELWQGQQRGKVSFTTDVVIPTLVKGDLWDKCNRHEHAVWMSITPSEILSARRGISLARGKCVVGGLGLGLFLRKIANKKTVTEIVVVEIEEDLLDWFGRDLCQQLAKETGKSITVICGDAMQELGKHGKDTRYLYDIWDGFPAYPSYKEEQAFATVDHFWGWGCLCCKD